MLNLLAFLRGIFCEKTRNIVLGRGWKKSLIICQSVDDCDTTDGQTDRQIDRPAVKPVSDSHLNSSLSLDQKSHYLISLSLTFKIQHDRR